MNIKYILILFKKKEKKEKANKQTEKCLKLLDYIEKVKSNSENILLFHSFTQVFCFI